MTYDPNIIPKGNGSPRGLEPHSGECQNCHKNAELYRWLDNKYCESCFTALFAKKGTVMPKKRRSGRMNRNERYAE